MVYGLDYKEDMSEGSHDIAGYILTEEDDGSKHLVKEVVYNKNETTGELEVAMTKPTDEAKQTLQPFTDIATFIDLQEPGSLTDDAKKEFMEEVNNILHEMIKEDSATVNNLFGSVLAGTYEIEGKTFTINASTETFDKIVENFNSIGKSKIPEGAKKIRRGRFDELLRNFVNYGYRLGNDNAILKALYDSMNTTEPINNSKDTSWESCNITIR